MVRIAILISMLFNAAACAASEVRSGGPYVPTPQPVVEKMLVLARVGPDDFIMDLGSGDGRIVLTAAARYRARGMGVDLDADLVEQSNTEARRRGVEKLATFRQGDALKVKISDATVVTLYLLPGLLNQLRGRFISELRPGTRVVSHDFAFSEWMPDRKVTVDAPEKYGAGHWQSTLYLWIVPARVQGRWHAAVGKSADRSFIFTFSQSYQQLGGDALAGGERITLEEGRLEGVKIRFMVPEMTPKGRVLHEYTGTVDGDTIKGEVRSPDGIAPWRATRLRSAASLMR
jgi:hypothetical protein